MRSWSFVAPSLAAGFLLSLSCTRGGAPVDMGRDVMARRAVLENVAHHVVLPTLASFVPATEALVRDAEAYATTPEDAQRTALAASFSAAMDVWQRAELHQLGPAAMSRVTPGGADLRDTIYAWPLTNPCRIDQVTAEGRYGEAGYLASLPVNVRGLGAIEYLLYDADTNHACPASSALVTMGTWESIRAEIPARRRAHAAALARDLRASAQDLHRRWSVGGGAFADELAHAGDGSRVYATTQLGLNAVSDALFYLDVVTKDMKLAVPAGLSNCASVTCPDQLESLLSTRSKENIRINLTAFREVFFGTREDGSDGPGFDDLVTAAGYESLTTRMGAAIAAALVALDAVPGNLRDALMTDRASVVRAFDAVKVVTDMLKTEVVSVLDLELPRQVEGDND